MDRRMPKSGARSPQQFNRRPRRAARRQQRQPIPQVQTPQSPNFPKQPDAPPDFLPMTPEYEGVRRNAADQLAAAEAQYTKGVGMIQPTLDFNLARLGTDRGYAQDRLDEGMSERGLLDSGVRSQLARRDIAIPFGRQKQDWGLAAAQQYADLDTMLSGARLGYNQTLSEALLNRAAQVANEMPWSVPQYGYDIPDQPPTRLNQGGKRRRNRKNRRRR